MNEAKQTIRALLDRLPDDCSIDDVLYHLFVMHAIEQGRADVAAGRVLSQRDVEQELRKKWLAGRAE